MADPLPSPPAMQLTIAQQFELERMTRTIDGTSDVKELRKLAKMLLQAWHSQKAATQWVMRQHCGATMLRRPEPVPAPWDDPLM